MADVQKDRPWRVLLVEEDDDVARLDTWICSQIEGLSRRRAQTLIAAGEITVNGSRPKKSRELKSGDEIIVWTQPDIGWFQPAPNRNMDLTIL